MQMADLKSATKNNAINMIWTGNGFGQTGGDLAYSYFIKKNLSVGIDLGWNNYWKYVPTTTCQFKTGAATTDLYHYIFTLPIRATVTKYYHIGFGVCWKL
jgi:hypothetical protein